jgi:magnesium chelatase family protein
MNPSSKGTWYDPARVESPSLHEMKRYLSRICGPLWDRMELQIEVSSQELSFWNGTKQESSEDIAGRVAEARNRMTHRFAHRPLIHTNAQMDANELDRNCAISSGGEQLIKHAVEKLSLSTRAYVQILRVSRTIADLEGVPQVSAHHLAEAIQFRSLDRLKGVL